MAETRPGDQSGVMVQRCTGEPGEQWRAMMRWGLFRPIQHLQPQTWWQRGASLTEGQPDPSIRDERNHEPQAHLVFIPATLLSPPTPHLCVILHGIGYAGDDDSAPGPVGEVEPLRDLPAADGEEDGPVAAANGVVETGLVLLDSLRGKQGGGAESRRALLVLLDSLACRGEQEGDVTLAKEKHCRTLDEREAVSPHLPCRPGPAHPRPPPALLQPHLGGTGRFLPPDFALPPSPSRFTWGNRALSRGSMTGALWRRMRSQIDPVGGNGNDCADRGAVLRQAGKMRTQMDPMGREANGNGQGGETAAARQDALPDRPCGRGRETSGDTRGRSSQAVPVLSMYCPCTAPVLPLYCRSEALPACPASPNLIPP